MRGQNPIYNQHYSLLTSTDTNSGIGRRDSGAKLPGLKSQLCHSPAVQPRVGYLTSWSFPSSSKDGDGTYKVDNSVLVTLSIPVTKAPTKPLEAGVLLVPGFRQFSPWQLGAVSLRRTLWQWDCVVKDVLHLLVFRKQREDIERGQNKVWPKASP